MPSTYRSAARHWLAPGLAAALLAAGACTARQSEPTGTVLQSSTVAGRSDEQALRDLHARWTALGIARYQFVLARECFCVPEVREPAVVEVRDGAVARVTSKGDGRELDGSLFLTIDHLFERAIEAARNGEPIELQHDERYAYPTRLTVGSLAADAGVVYAVSEVRRLD